MRTEKIRTTHTSTKHENGRTKLSITGRTESGEEESVTVTGWTPRFYVLTDELEPFRDTLEFHSDVLDVEDGYESIYGEDLTCIKVIDSRDVPELRELFDTHYEADVWYRDRSRIDLGIETGIEFPETPDGEVHWTEISPEEFTEPDYRVVTFDIETDDRGAFPDSENPEHRVLSIVAHDSYDDEYVGWIDLDGRSMEDCFPSMVEQLPEEYSTFQEATANGFDLSKIDPPGKIDKLRCRPDERQMLIDFATWVDGVSPDILTGWNFTDFDAPYLFARMKEVGANPARMARGDSPYCNVNDGNATISGRWLYDMMRAYETTKFTDQPSYTLDNTAKRELGKEKIQFTGDYWDLYQDDPEKFLEYNARDTYLTVKLDKELDIISFKESLQRRDGVTFDNTMEANGPVEMALRRRMKQEGVVGPSRYQFDGEARDFEGGFVVDAYEGVAENVMGIDLASLYPNNVAMANLSPETKIPKEEAESKGIPYVESPNGTCFRLDQEGIVSGKVDEWLDLKSELKQRLKEMPPDHPEHESLQERYNVTKTIVNALYGVIGWTHFFLYDPDVAESCTLLGQEAIKETRRYVNEETEATVIYGDSIPDFEPVYVKQDGNVDILPVSEVYKKYEPGTFQVWNDHGWSKCNDVIQKPNRKEMYRVRTGSGMVHVTEDHGLLREDGTEVPPTDIEPGDTLMHTELGEAYNAPWRASNISPEKAWLYGVMVADGTAKGSQWKVCKNDRDLLDKISDRMESVFGFDTEVKDYTESSGVLQLRGDDNEWGAVTELCSELEPKLYDSNGKKRIPPEVLNSHKRVMEAFLGGYQAGDGDDDERYKKTFHRSYTDSHTLAAQLVYLLEQVGEFAGVNYRDNHGNEYPRIHSRNKNGSNEVIEVEKVDYDREYVYDLSTESEHFNAGIGQITVHNTDSNYIKFPDHYTREECEQRAIEISRKLNEEVYPEFWKQFYHTPGTSRPPECRWEIEPEDYIRRFFQHGRKKFYAYLSESEYGEDDDGNPIFKPLDEPEMGVKGYQAKKSNFSELTRETNKKVLEAIVKDNQEELIGIIQEAASEIRQDMDDWTRIGIPQGLGQQMDPDKPEGPDGYYEFSRGKPKDAHPRGAWNGNQTLGLNLSEGSKPKRVYLDPRKSIDGIDVVAFEENYELDGHRNDLHINEERMIEKQVLKPNRPIFDALGMDIEAAMAGMTQTGFGDFV